LARALGGGDGVGIIKAAVFCDDLEYQVGCGAEVLVKAASVDGSVNPATPSFLDTLPPNTTPTASSTTTAANTVFGRNTVN
jgi:hypothetical protein